MYKEIKPSLDLNKSIDAIWVYSNDEATDRFKVLPDTCTDLIFDLNQNKGFISGIMSSYQQLEFTQPSDLIGIRFKAEKFGSLSLSPLHEAKNSRVDIADIFDTDNIELLDELSNLETEKDKVQFLENFIASALKQSYQRQDELIISVAEKIRLLKGILNIEDLAVSYHLSLRQLQRRFKNYIGLSLKEFANLIRFNYAKETIKNSDDKSLMEIAFNMGYYDHSHMNYEFSRISGENPSHFR